MAEKEYYAHPTAVIDEPCQIGKGTKIWHFSHVMKGAIIGEVCSLGQNVYVGSKVRIGRKLQDPEQRQPLRLRGAGGRCLLRAQHGLYERDQSPLARVAEG